MPLAEPTTCDACGATHRLTDLWKLARPNGSSVYVCAGCQESTP
jgi:hypothetical protein